ncbi:unnamed protein product [Closterium sp. Naga37s-1]|nr:unnamed protein product [Closterium sp. Naga37s-1]
MPSIRPSQPQLLQAPDAPGSSTSVHKGAQAGTALPLLPHTSTSGPQQMGNQMQPLQPLPRQVPAVVLPVQQQQPIPPQAGQQPMQVQIPTNQPAPVNEPSLAELPSHHMKPRNAPLEPLSQPGQPGQRMRDREVDCQYRTEGKGQNLHRCAMGYAGWANVTGGKGKLVYWVSSAMDHPTQPLPGSLRWALLKHRGGATIRFSRSMVVNLTDRLFVRSDTTIDGRGATVKINGPMAVYRSRNVIIHNLAIGNAKGNTDALHIRNSSRVWVDHCRVTNADCLRNIELNFTILALAFSFRCSFFSLHNASHLIMTFPMPVFDLRPPAPSRLSSGFTMLLGAADNDTFDTQMRVTVYRNWFFGSGQRQPHGRWGKIHVANNLYTNWTYYCLGGRVHANIRSDRNIFIAGKGRKEVTPWFGPQSPSVPGFDNTPTIRSFNDSLRNGATFHVFPGTPPKPTFVPPYKLPLHSADDILGTFVARNAGPRVGTAPLLPCTTTTCWSCC